MTKKLAYLSAMASFIATSVISINFGIFQLSLFRGLIVFISLAAVTKVLLSNGKFHILRKSTSSYSIKFMLIWLSYALLSLGWVNDYVGWIKAIFFLSIGVLCVLIYSKYFTKSNDILTSFRFMSILIMIHNLIGWYEIKTGNYMFLTSTQAYYIRHKLPVSMFGNTNNFATFLLISIFILYVCLANSKLKPIKMLYITTIVSSIYLLVMTTSRANLVGLIMASGSFVWLSVQNKKRRLFLIVMLLLMLVVSFAMPGFSDSISQMIDGRFKLSADNESNNVRLNLIKNGFNFLVNTAGFGIGAGNIEYWMENYEVYATQGVTNIHNWWMEILVAYGVAIFMLYIIFFIKLFRDLYRVYKNSSNKVEISISLGFMCSMVGFVLGSISSSSIIIFEWLWVYWALAIAFQGHSTQSSTRNRVLLAKESII
jgi:teichuronic acid biosynthesis protein TuaE